MTTSDTHGYCYFRQYLVRSDQSLFRAVRVLLLGYRRHRVRSLGISCGDIVVGLLILIRHRLNRNARPAIELSVAGDIAIRVHRGHKVFDLDAARVTKVFAGDVTEDEAAAQVDASKLASAVRAAPRFLGADEQLRWYTEEYVRGQHGTDTLAALEGRYMDFYPDVEACLLELIDTGSHNRVDLTAYLDALTDPDFFKSWDAKPESRDAAREIRGYQAGLKCWLLDNLPMPEMELVLIHGDFSLVNVIVDEKFRVIDWEGIRYGSMFGDVFNFVFVEKYYGRARSDVTAEMDDARSRFARAAVQRFPRLASAALVPAAFALRLYYLERLKIMLERDVTANLLSVIRKSMDMFCDFDAAAGLPKTEEC